MGECESVGKCNNKEFHTNSKGVEGGREIIKKREKRRQRKKKSKERHKEA